MKADEICTLYDYNYWVNRRILDAAAQFAHFLTDFGRSPGNIDFSVYIHEPA